MKGQHEVTAKLIEATFGQPGSGLRFASFCNAVIVAESTGPVSSLPVLSEKPGADGSFDGEWTIELPPETPFSNPFAEVGWNIFQFKARSIEGGGRPKAVSGLKSSLKGALEELLVRLKRQKEPSRYVLFTNLQLGLETESTTQGGATLSQDRIAIEAAVRDGSARAMPVHVIDAAQLAALSNKHSALRLTYFSSPTARSWHDKWNEESAVRNYKTATSLIGRKAEMDQITAWIENATVKAIGIIGPSGIGKTRLALEGTKIHHLHTTIVDVVDEFERWGLSSFGSPAQETIIIVEDPDPKQAERLARQALAASGVKLIFTASSEADAPILKLTAHEGLKTIVLQPLKNEDAKELLSAAKARFDQNALDWILLQAGGNPEILLSAAELGNELREKSGSLKVRLADLYQRRIEAAIGPQAIATLRLVSVLQWTKINGTDVDLPAIISAFGASQPAVEVVDLLLKLERLGYIRRRGDYVMAVPPIFAGALAEERFTSQPDALCALFDRLTDDGRKRLLERLAASNIDDKSVFWNHVYKEAFGTMARLKANLGLLDYLARANPLGTAQFLSQRSDELTDQFSHNDYDPDRTRVIGTLRELAHHTTETSAIALGIIEGFALREDSVEHLGEATKLFSECFVHWYISFPLSFQRRENWLRRMLESDDPRRRILAMRAVVTVTAPPHVLSGYGVHARKLRPRPQVRFWREVHDYLEHSLDLRFDQTQSADNVASDIARKDLVRALGELSRHLPADRVIKQLEKAILWHAEKKIQIDERDLRALVHRLEVDYKEKSEEPTQAGNAEKWKDVLQRLQRIRLQLDEGPFVVRLKIALGPEFDTSWEEIQGKRVYGFEQRCRALAGEAVNDRTLMSPQAWAILQDRDSAQVHTYIVALGELDKEHHYLSDFEVRCGGDFWDFAFARYLAGVHQHSPSFVDTRLEELASKSNFPRGAVLSAIKHVGPTAGNRARLLAMIQQKLADPIAVARLFTTGGWLDNLPVTEVQAIIEFIATGGSEWPKWMLRVMTLYVHPGKPLPQNLIPIVTRGLRQLNRMELDLEWDCNSVATALARTDCETAFALFRDQILVLSKLEWHERESRWSPFQEHGSHDFWRFLCQKHPERSCGELFAAKDDVAELKSAYLPVDLERDLEAVLKFARETEKNAIFIVEYISGAEKGFFPFAYKLMDGFPGNDRVRSKLAAAAMYRTGNGIECDNYEQALSNVEAQLQSGLSDPNHLRWLNEIKQRMRESPKVGRWRDDPYLGWN